MTLNEYRKDEYKKVQIPFGFNTTLEKVLLPLFHTFFVAMTGHGKTLGMKSLLLRFHELFPDWKILIIDSKDKRDYADLHADIPICFVETTDPLDLKNLLEPIVGAKMMYYFDKIIEEAVFDTLGEIQRNINRKVEDADAGRTRIHSKELGKLRVINFTMRKLVQLVEKPNIVNNLQLHDGFNVMPVALPDVKNPNLKRAFQQLIVRSVLILLLSDQSLQKTLLVLDEVHKWSPQKYSSICKQPLSEFVSEGRSQDKILWESDQALTKVDKEPLKNIKIWIVGQQMESNEVEDAKNTVNDMTDLSITDSDIKTLKIGNFILVNGLQGRVDRAYLQPYGVPDKVTLEIAKGADPELAEPFIVNFESKLQKGLEGDEEMYRAKYEELLKQVETIRLKAFEEGQASISTDVIENNKLLSEKNKKLEKDFEDFRKATEQEVLDLREKLGDSEKTIGNLTEKLEKFEAFQAAFRDLFGVQPATTQEHEQSLQINLDTSMTEITVEDKAPKEVTLTTEKPSGQLMFSALQLHDRALKEKPDVTPVFTSAELQKEALEYGWQLTNYTIGKTLGFIIREGWFIKEDNGYRLPTKLKINVKDGIK